MMGPCCPGKPVAKRLRIGGQMVGIADLDAVIGEALDLTDDSEEELKAFLLSELKESNYIPSEMEGEYAAAIWDEFVRRRSEGISCPVRADDSLGADVMSRKKNAKSGGIPREEIPWNPTIDAEKCTGCEICAEFCQHGVYKTIDDKVRVSNPTACVVGCTGCLTKCPEGAISFPDQKEFVETLRRLRAKRS